MQKRCSACLELKDVGDFAWRFKERRIRDSYCRACRAAYKQAHYAANRRRYIESAARRRLRNNEENLTQLVEYLRAHPCMDCGEADPLVLEFDHLGQKTFQIGGASRDLRWETIEREIANCEVVCANCHRRRTARRGGFKRAEIVDRPSRGRTIGLP